MQNLSDRIRQARELTGMTRAALGRRVGVRPSAAVQWEQENGTAPSVENLAKIAVITDVAFEWLATGRGPPRPIKPHEVPAVVAADFAHNLVEERLLQIARMLPVKKRDALLNFLEALLGKRT